MGFLSKVSRELKRQRDRVFNELDRWQDAIAFRPLREVLRWPENATDAASKFVDQAVDGYTDFLKQANPLMKRLIDGHYPPGMTFEAALQQTLRNVVSVTAGAAALTFTGNPVPIILATGSIAADAAGRVAGQEEAKERERAIEAAELAAAAELEASNARAAELERLAAELEANPPAPTRAPITPGLAAGLAAAAVAAAWYVTRTSR